MACVPLATLTRDQRLALTGRAFDLPKAKGASQPMYWDGKGLAPAEHGTRISVWNLSVRDPLNGSWWIASASRDSTWNKPCVFRFRDAPPADAMPQMPAIREGMGLRDWFAGQALSAFTHPDWDAAISAMAKAQGSTIGKLRAELSYELADRMLAARKGATS